MDLSRYVQAMRGGFSRARGKRRPTVAFALSGGGVLGSIQVGQLLALLEAGIVPDLLIGTSVGALNAAAIAADPTTSGAERLREVWTGLRSEDIFPGTRVQRAWNLIARGDHLYDNRGIRRLIDMLPVGSFEELRRPLQIGAANLHTGREHWFSQGPLEPALLASTALPGIFPPVEVGGQVLVDGGVVNNVPIARAVELGATHIFVLTCGAVRPGPRPVRRPLDILVQAVTRARAARVEAEVERYRDAATIEILPVVDPGAVRYNDLSQSGRLIETARLVAAEHLGRPSVITL